MNLGYHISKSDKSYPMFEISVIAFLLNFQGASGT